MQTTILCELSDAVALINEERLSWTFSVLEALGIPKEVFSSKSIDEYRLEMNKFGVDVELTSGGDVNIFKKTWHDDKNPEMIGWLPNTQANLVAQWKEPDYVKKIEDGKVYYEIRLNEWSSVGKGNG